MSKNCSLKLKYVAQILNVCTALRCAFLNDLFFFIKLLSIEHMILSETENISLFIVMERKYSWGFITYFCCGCALKTTTTKPTSELTVLCVMSLILVKLRTFCHIIQAPNYTLSPQIVSWAGLRSQRAEDRMGIIRFCI